MSHITTLIQMLILFANKILIRKEIIKKYHLATAPSTCIEVKLNQIRL